MSDKKAFEPPVEEFELQKGTVITTLNSHDEVSFDVADLDKTATEFDEEKIKDYFSKLSDESTAHFLKETGHGDDLNHDNKDDLTFDLKFILDKIINMSNKKVLDIYQNTSKHHQNDPNFPTESWEYIHNVLDKKIDIDETFEENFKAKLAAALIYHHSPYPEVRAVTDLSDDPNEPVETIRSYTIAVIWLVIGAGINEFFSHRQPSIYLPSSVISVLMYPCGKLWELIMPNCNINFFGKKLPLNPGPYSYKEQMFALTLTTVGTSSVYVSYNIVTQVKFYHLKWISFGYQLLLTLSTQTMGFAFAGILRKFVIYPERAIWPSNLATLALNRALLKPERKEVINGWKISKYNFFWTCFLGMFAYYWLPGYLFTALSSFSWISWIAPYNFNLDVVTGSSAGLGLNPLSTFDWNVMQFLVNPLTMPFYATMNVFLGMVVGFFVVLGIYYSNHKWSAYLPVNTNAIFTNTGESFDVTKILSNGVFDNTKYQKYSPPFYTAASLASYGSFYMIYPFAFLFNSYKEWDTIKFALQFMVNDFKETFRDFSFRKTFKMNSVNPVSKFDDPQSRLMARYKEVPDWCYWSILVVSLIISILTVKIYPETKTPVWGVFSLLV